MPGGDSPDMRRLRRFKPKAKTGCITCKIRRIKCDEAKPNCVKCSSTGRKCDGYVPDLVKKDDQIVPREHQGHKLPILKLSTCLLETTQEQRSLEYFFNRTAPALSGYYDADFWNSLLLQFSYSESAIRHAMMAVSSLHEQFESSASYVMPLPTSTGTGARHRFALQQYNRAISQLAGQLSSRQQTMESTLMLCILFVCIECLRGDSEAVLTHLESGITILCTWRAKKINYPSQNDVKLSSNSRFVEEILVPIFARLNILLALFGRAAAPLRSNSENDATGPQMIQPNSITSLFHARLVLGDLMSMTTRFIQIWAIKKYKSVINDATINEQETLTAQFHHWSAAFATLTRDSAVRWSARDRQGADLLKVQYTTILVMLSTSLSIEEAALDRYMPEFEYIVKMAGPMVRGNPEGTSLSSSLHVSNFSFEMGIVPPLYYVAIKCRSPPLRRHALDLLSNMSRRESLWDARRLSKVAERVIAIEETILDERSGFPREEARIHAVQNDATAGPAPLLLILKSLPDGFAGEWLTREEYIVIAS